MIDFGSACFEGSPLYTYIQSRHYRAPEIILGLQYTYAIDMWSFGCVIAELLLGIPIFPGENEYNQLVKIIDMVGMPSKETLDRGTKTTQFFKKVATADGGYIYQLLTPEEYWHLNGVNYVENKRYHRYRSIQEFCAGISMHRSGDRKASDDANRTRLCDFLQRVFVLDPSRRITPEEAAQHPLFHTKMQQKNVDWSMGTWSTPLEVHVSIDTVIRRIYKRPIPIKTLQEQNFSVERYYQTFIKALNAGIVLNVLGLNPFKLKPLKCGLPSEEEEDDESMDSLPPVSSPIVIRSRSRSIGWLCMDDSQEKPNENPSKMEEDEELPPIGFSEVSTPRRMTLTPVRNSLRPPKHLQRTSYGPLMVSPGHGRRD